MTKTYAQLAREIATLQATASKLYAIEVKTAVQKVNELIAQYGLSASDLVFAASPGTGKSASVGKSAAAGAPGVKYSDGEGRVWGGRGPRPAWLRSAIAAGRSLESFLAAGAADIMSALSPSAGGKATKAAARKPAATGVAKFVNPKTGAGWSGRGPRPQWLKDALKKRGSKIEDFLGDKPAMSEAAAAPAPAPAAPAKKAAAKKSAAPAKKSAVKKVAAKKAAARKVSAAAAPATPAKKVPAKAPAKKAVKTAAKAPAKKAAAKAPAKKAAVAGVAAAAPAVAPAAEAHAPAAKA